MQNANVKRIRENNYEDWWVLYNSRCEHSTFFTDEAGPYSETTANIVADVLKHKGYPCSVIHGSEALRVDEEAFGW